MHVTRFSALLLRSMLLTAHVRTYVPYVYRIATCVYVENFHGSRSDSPRRNSIAAIDGIMAARDNYDRGNGREVRAAYAVFADGERELVPACVRMCVRLCHANGPRFISARCTGRSC